MTLRKAAERALSAMQSFEGGTNGLYEGEFAEEIATLKAALSDDPLRLVAENRLRILFANKWVQADSRGTSCREPLGDPYEALCKAIQGASK
jgi:hypothetical protein